MFWPVTRLLGGVTGSIGGTAAVQQESTATGPDAGGPEWTREDGDLRLHTRVDGLPLDGMQEVWGSNPHSSTGQKRNSKTRATSTAEKYSNSDRMRCRISVRIGYLPRPGCWQRLRIPRHRGSCQAAELEERPVPQSYDSCRAPVLAG